MVSKDFLAPIIFKVNVMAEKKESSDVMKYPSFESLSDRDKQAAESMADEYVTYLDSARTVHTTIDTTVEMAEKKGFIKYTPGMTLDNIGGAPGLIFIDRNHLDVAIVRLGKKDVTEGINIAGAHVDFVSLINKAHPLMEKEDGIYLDTRPYGGFLNHQWMDNQLNIIGETVLDIKNDDGKIVDHKTVSWEIDGTIPEATVHNPGGPKTKNSYSDMFPTEKLDVFTGYTSKTDFLAEISRQTGHEMTEEEFNSAKTEFTVVPDAPTKRLGDYVIGYGHDDRSCMFSTAKAIIGADDPTYTSIAFGVAREEIGSTGIGGAQARFLENVVKKVAKMQGHNSVDLDSIYTQSIMFSADVDIAYNPQNASVNDKQNSGKFGHGASIVMSNGRNGNGAGNYVTARDLHYFTDPLGNNGVVHQETILQSKVGIGGGFGTIAKFYSEKGILTADLGVPLGNMHGLNARLYKGDLYAVEQAFEALITRDLQLEYFG